MTSKHPNVETRDRAETNRKIIQGQENKPEWKQKRELVLQGQWRKSRDSEVKETRLEEDR